MTLSQHYLVALFTTSFTLFSIAVFVYFKNPGKKINRTFSFYSLCIAIWALGQAYHNSAVDEISAIFWARYFHAGVIFISTSFVHFIFVLLGIDKEKRKVIIFLYAVSFVFLIFNFSRLFISGAVPKFSLDYYWEIGPLYIPFLIFWVGSISYSLYKLYGAYHSSAGIKRNQLKYLFWATLLGYIGGSSNYLPVFNIYLYPFNPFGTYAVPIYASVTAYAIVKYQLMDIKVAVTRAGIFLTVYTLVLGFPFWAGYHSKSWFISTSFMFVLATVGPLIYRFLQKKAENVLLARQKHYQKILLQAAKGMVREHNLHRLEKLIVHIVKKAVKIEFAAIFLEDKEKKCYSLRAVRDHHTFPKDFVFPSGHDLIKYIKEKQAILVYENVNHFFKEFTDNGVHLIVPTFVEDRLLGFLILGEKHDQSLYTEEDINVFNTLSHQTALAIENCSFFEEFKNAQEKIFLAEKLASIGGMADGVAHQIKNRLNHFSIAAGEMQFEIKDFIRDHPGLVKENPKLKKSFDYLTGIAESLITNVKRTDGVIRGILNYARTSEKDTFFSEFSFREIVDLALDLLKVKHEVAEIPLVTDLDKDDVVFGVKAQLLEVLYNILDNGYEAIQEKIGYFHLSGEKKEDFHPEIVLKLTQNPNNSLIEISDNGIGVKDEDKQKIFAPFFTTKSSYKSGTGIGMYVVKRLIEENHGGKVWFKTKYKEGTTFLIKLKKK